MVTIAKADDFTEFMRTLSLMLNRTFLYAIFSIKSGNGMFAVGTNPITPFYLCMLL